MTLRPIFYDTETTGTNSETDYIIELAAFDPVNNLTFEELIKPLAPIPAGATAIHGITDQMVSEKPSFGEIGKKFIEFCSGPVVLIAHNNDGFDKLFIQNEFKRHQLQLPDWQYFDTLKWARKYRPDLPRHSLQHLREVYGFEANNAHRALDDVITLKRVFDAMTDDLPIDVLCSLINENRLIQIMPFGKYKGKALLAIPADYIQWLFKNGAMDKKENESLRKSFEKLGLIPA